jgi:phosphoribosylaminoimidazole carboxylase (NCAIR synthetase)
LQGVPLILEGYVDFDSEVSIIGAARAARPASIRSR